MQGNHGAEAKEPRGTGNRTVGRRNAPPRSEEQSPLFKIKWLDCRLTGTKQ